MANPPAGARRHGIRMTMACIYVCRRARSPYPITKRERPGLLRASNWDESPLGQAKQSYSLPFYRACVRGVRILRDNVIEYGPGYLPSSAFG